MTGTRVAFDQLELARNHHRTEERRGLALQEGGTWRVPLSLFVCVCV